MQYLLDTNICIYIIKRSPKKVQDRFQTLKLGQVGISSITHCELEFGVAKSARPEQNREALSRFLAPLEVLDFPAAASQIYGDIRHHLQTSGRPIGSLDFLIAAHAVYLGATLVTNNQAEFARVPHLVIENWV
ncbi:MAG: type II toxin-antitoxin system VapC family toxin [Myxococcota bacterium]|nr:type II toxin-antitoxin system VapC family toxin [Myxococcota bacterium]